MHLNILNYLKLMLKLIGLLPNQSTNCIMEFYGWFACFGIFTLAYPMTVYAVSVIRDVWKVAGALPGLCGTWNAFVKSLTFLLHRKIVGKLLIDIQDNIDSKFSSGHSMEEYETLNSSAERFAKNYSFMLIACLIAYICTPIANISFHLLNGTFTDELLILPLEAIYPYDHTKMPAFVYTFIASSFSIYLLTFALASGDCFFMGMCQHIIACFRDLMNMFEQAIAKTSFQSCAAQQLNVLREIKKCVDFHINIFKFIENFEEWANLVIAFQFFVNMSQLCTLAFDLTMNTSPSLDQYIKDIILASTCFAQLFLYCYFGNELSLTSAMVCQRIYHSNWYVQKPIVQRFLKMAMMRSQKRIEVRGFKIVPCTLERFLKVLNTVGSLFAILKSAAA